MEPRQFIALTALLLTAQVQAENYICQVKAASGVAYTSGKWEGIKVNSDDSYVVVAVEETSHRYEVKRIGDKHPIASCEKGFEENEFIDCNGWQRFIFNRKTDRFMTSMMFGYIDGIDEAGIFPTLEVGVCNSF